MAYATWNPSDKGANVTLSNGNLTATITNGFQGSARATASISGSSKIYVEHTIGVGSLVQVGVGNASASTGEVSSGFAHDNNGLALNFNGFFTKNSVTIGSGMAFVNGDVIGVETDAGAGTVKFRKNGGTWTTFSGANVPAGALYPMAGGTGNTGQNLTTNFGASAWAAAPDAGYVGLVQPLAFTMTGNVGVQVKPLASAVLIPGFIGNVGVQVKPAAAMSFATSVRYTITPSGGVKISGTAPVSYIPVSIYTIAPSNTGVVLGGAAIVGAVTPWYPTGGVSIGGAAPVSDRIPWHPVGGVRVGGTAPVALVYAPPASGGVRVSGSAPRAIVYAPPVSGGVRVSGAASYSDRQAFYQPKGGMLLSGAALAYMLPAGFTPTAANPHGDPFPGWSLNFESNAPARILGLPANSFASLNGETYVANAGGIYKLDQKTDAGAAIRARVVLPNSDWGDAKNKRIPSVWVSGELASAMVMQVVTDQVDVTYYTVDPLDEKLRISRVEPGKGVEGRFIQLGFANIAGADFAFESVEVPPSVLKRHGR